MMLFGLLISCIPKKTSFTSDDLDVEGQVEEVVEIDSSTLLNDMQRFQNWFEGEYKNDKEHGPGVFTT